jgi:hypothetical protein
MLNNGANSQNLYLSPASNYGSLDDLDDDLDEVLISFFCSDHSQKSISNCFKASRPRRRSSFVISRRSSRARACPMRTMFLISRPFVSFSTRWPRNSIVSHSGAWPRLAFKIALCHSSRRESADKWGYEIDRWMRDRKSGSIVSTRFVVRKRMPSWYSRTRRSAEQAIR